MQLRVAIVEDDSLLRAAIAEALRSQANIDVVSSSESGAEVLAAVREGEVDVALLDVHLGHGPSGIDIARALRRQKYDVGIIFLSSVKDPRLLGLDPSELPMGARYLLKSEVSEISRLGEIVRQVAEDTLDGGDLAPSLPFTQAQIEILRLVAAGYSNQAIAKQRFVTERTVEVSVSRLAKHLGLREVPGSNQRVHIAATFFREMGWAQ